MRDREVSLPRAERGATTRSSVRGTLIAGGVSIVAILPMFLTGALAVQLGNDLVFGTAGLGLAVAAFRLSAAFTSPFLGRLTDRIGAIWSLRIAVVVAGTASAGVAASARSWGSLVAWLVVGGWAQGIGQPAANRLISRSVAPGRMGLAFGVKQSANPAASMLGGFSVPAIALTLGWRWAFWIVVGLALAVLMAIGRRRAVPKQDSGPREAPAERLERSSGVLFLVSFALAMAVGTAVPTFYVAATVAAGTAEGLAGMLLAVASLGALLTRLGSGALCDRMRGGHLRLFIGGLSCGVVGFALLATQQPALMAPGALIALAGTWGFNSVFWYALIRAYPTAPGAVTGTILPGGMAGGFAGPVLLGYLVEATTFTVAWSAAAVLSAVAAYAMLLGARRLAMSIESPIET